MKSALRVVLVTAASAGCVIALGGPGCSSSPKKKVAFDGTAGEAGASGAASSAAGSPVEAGAAGTLVSAGEGGESGEAGAGGASGSAGFGTSGSAGFGTSGSAGFGTSGSAGSGTSGAGTGGATAAGGSSGGAGSGGIASNGGVGGSGGPACLGNATLDFASRAPYWTDSSTACGTATFGSDGVTLTRDASCTAVQQGGGIQLDANWKLCGDFDLRVDFDLKQFAVPLNGSRWLAFRAYDPTSVSNGISLERYNVGLTNCFPSTLTYKSWTSLATDCTGAIFRATADVTGTMRLTRTGSTVVSYTQIAGDGGAVNGWSSFATGTAMTTAPWTIDLYTGVYNGDASIQSVAFSNLVINSSSAP